MIILGIESSCDDTAAAVVSQGVDILSSVVSSQLEAHHPFGGVVPEIASREHMAAIAPVVEEALQTAGVAFNEIDAIAATMGPGLIGSLLVGFSFAKACAFALDIPWVGVNHLEGHVNSVFLEPDSPSFPFVALLASGGHTSIYHVVSHTRMELMGQTRDDAAGEAYDKVSAMLGSGYPGGKIIDDLAHAGTPGKVSFPRSYLDKEAFDFSFSGIKTAVNRYIQMETGQMETDEGRLSKQDIAAEFQEAVTEVLVWKLIQAALKKECRQIAVVGGVAANRRLRERVAADAAEHGIQAFLPSPSLCGDNAAMIAATGYYHLLEQDPARRKSGFDADVFSKIPRPPISKKRPKTS